MIKEDELNKLFKYALSLCRQEEQAWDLVHDAVLNSRKYILINKEAYLKRMVRNAFYDELKRRARNIDFNEELATNQLNIEEEMQNKNEINFLLSKLSSEEREILFLHYVEGYSYKEISKLSGMKVGTIMSKLSRSKDKMREAK
jgi:RNA polymerase sigma-70 factor (ECF subfamily)